MGRKVFPDKNVSIILLNAQLLNLLSELNKIEPSDGQALAGLSI